MTRLAIFCGSSSHVDETFFRAARDLGQLIAQQKLELVYGGSSLGLMGAVSDEVLKQGGQVIGVMPDFMMNLECSNSRIQDLRIVSSMHERKKLMSDLADAFIALPGGFGTLDELFEIITWRQLHLHDKPIGILNFKGYFDSLLQFADRAVSDGFVRAEHRDFLVVESDPRSLLRRLTAH
jgi:hypothetical protein